MSTEKLVVICLTLVALLVAGTLAFSCHKGAMCQDKFIPINSPTYEKHCDYGGTLETVEGPEKGFICHCPRH